MRRLQRYHLWIATVGLGVAVFAAGVGTGRALQPEPALRVVVRTVTVPAPGVGGGEPHRSFPSRYAALQTAERRLADRADSALARIPASLPLEGARLTSSYTARRFHPILRRVRPHWGVDLAAPHGAPVISPADGVVIGAVRNRSYGLVVDVRHGGEYITRYAHLSSLAVRHGDVVKRGQMVGRVGSTGMSTAPHLHYEVFVQGRRRDPTLLFDPDAAETLLP